MKYSLLFIWMFSWLNSAHAGSVTITYNNESCSNEPGNSYSICLLNKTESDLSSKDIALQQFITVYAGFDCSIKNFGIWQKGRYINIGIPKTFFTTPHPDFWPKKLEYNLTTYFANNGNGTVQPGCQFSWSIDSPPYSTPVILTLERKGNGFYCHY